MSQLILDRGLTRKNLLQKYIPNIQMGPYFLLFSLVLFVAMITIVTLMFSARQVTKGYVLSSLDSEYQELLREGERHDMEISQVRSLKFIEESTQVRRMTSPPAVVYLHSETAIAQN